MQPVPPRPSTYPPVGGSSRVGIPKGSGGSERPAQAPRSAANDPDEKVRKELTGLLLAASSIDERFSTFTTWLRIQTGALSVFIVDAEGLPMTVDGADEDQRALAGSLAEPFQSAQRLVPNVVQSSARLRMASGEFLEMTWCESALGRFGVGSMSTTPLSASWSLAIPELFKQAVDGRLRSSQTGEQR